MKGTVQILVVASVIFNLLNAVLVAATCLTALRKAEPKHILFRYFTILSNMYCAAASLALGICSMTGSVPLWAVLWKYSGTCAVTVTFLTVMLFLGPTMKNYRSLLSGYEFFLHLLCPLLAIVSYIAFENTDTDFYTVIYGVLPVVVYGGLYYYKVMRAPEEKKWNDFYGFNRGGKWPLSMAAMLICSFLISIILWLV